MADTLGLMTLPVTAPVLTTDVVSDMLLQRLGAVIQASLNRLGNTAWQSRTPGRSVVAHVFCHNPQRLFDESRLPALYLWRSSSAREQLADDVLSDTSTITIYWLPEPAQEAHQVAREPFFNAIAKALKALFFRERDPAWVVTGDTDTLAATQGSFLPTWLGYNKIALQAVSTLELSVSLVDGDGGRQQPFYGVATSVIVEEIAGWNDDDFTEPTALDATITTGGVANEIDWIYEPPMP